ncbi:type II toxin-antitoxin system HicA family toxin [Novosphingobium sp. TCA1]|uniref:type II toxin-antitoxin system HicA family toxin n=1 Tax=Novosphingobium sp. TCA1 TaxID=2682474 RepID=UPI001F3BC342|nr:type II toxin-antitoxin system HicA family toxin [Novosphingobium sp. TCA1]
MIKPAKLHLQLLEARSRTIPFRDFERLLKAFGFTHVRTKGSHQIWTHPALDRPFPVQPNAKDAKPIRFASSLNSSSSTRYM